MSVMLKQLRHRQEAVEQGRKSATFQKHGEEVSLLPEGHCGIMGKNHVALELERPHQGLSFLYTLVYLPRK